MKLENILHKVEKPSRYIGGELNTFQKPIHDQLIRFGFSFPDVYEVGMSHLGLQIIYQLLNNEEDVFCERVFSPWHDMEAYLREEKLPLFTLESKTSIDQLDILGFTLQYELSFTNILNILDMGNIPFYSKDRHDQHPLIVAGGPCAYNPEPIADFVDIFFIGEGEEQLISFIEVYRPYKRGEISKDEMLMRATKIKGAYVPKFYTPVYNEDGTIKEVLHTDDVPAKIKKAIVKDFNEGFILEKMIVPFADVVHDRAMMEIFRGCTRGCRFCQAGMIYRPIRERSPETIKRTVDKLLRNTGFEEVSLTSLSTMDHSEIGTVVTDLIEKYEEETIGVSLPSLRLDSFSVDVVKEIQKVRKTGLTFAPEAGTQRMRDVINKGVTSENIETTLRSIFGLGWNRVKLYFMIGLPTETEEDLEGISEIGNLATYLFKQEKPEDMMKGVKVTISTSCFVPKPFTPFQWMPQDSIESFYEKINYLKSKIINRKVTYNYHDPKTSVLEGVFARGDRRLSKVIVRAYELGCKFDGWQECFDYDKWLQAFEATGVDPSFYNVRERSYDEVLPWDIIDPGVTKKYLKNEYEKSKEAITTYDCREKCTGCGVNVDIATGVC